MPRERDDVGTVEDLHASASRITALDDFGGGPAGLVAARELRRADPGLDVLVVEREPQLGRRSRVCARDRLDGEIAR